MYLIQAVNDLIFLVEKETVFLKGFLIHHERYDYMTNQAFQSHGLSIENRVTGLMEALTFDEKISLLSTHQSAIPRLGIKEYFIGGEAAHGVVDRQGIKTTVFPQPIGLSNSWNKLLMHQVGSAIGDEARAFYQLKDQKTGLTLWAPTIDMERDPRWGRTEEAYGEDPHLTGELSASLIKGMQGEDPFYVKLVAAPKHFYGNNNEKGREDTSNSIDLRNRKEYYLKAFEPAFTEAKALSMMTAYNGVNGIPCMQIQEIEEIVRDEWGMEGFVVSDGGALTLNVKEYQYYDTFAEALADALKKGIDCFVDDKELVEQAALDACDRDLISEDDIDRAVSRIVKVRFRLGHFDADTSKNPYANIEQTVLNHEKHQKLAKQVTDESIVLLKNEQNLLPLNREKMNKLAVLGPTSNKVFRDWYTGYSPYQITPLEGIKNLTTADIVFHDGFDRIAWKTSDNEQYLSLDQANNWTISDDKNRSVVTDEDWGNDWHVFKSLSTDRYLTQPDKQSTYRADKEEVFDWFNREKIRVKNSSDKEYSLSNWQDHPITIEQERVVVKDDTCSTFEKEIIDNGIQTAVELAKESDVAIVCVGNHPMVNGKETEDREHINLPLYQQRLIEEVYKVNQNMIVVVISSYPFAINWAQDHVPAILYSAHGSQELGTSLASILFGESNPSGRLSMTWPKDSEQLPAITDYDIRKGKRTYQYAEDNILYSFGHGLSYGEVRYDSFSMDKTTISDNEKVTITCNVKNVSDYLRDEVVQLYATVTDSYYERPNKQLTAFEKVSLKPGEERVLRFNIRADQLQVFDIRINQFVLEKGKVLFSIGKSSEELIHTYTAIEILGEEITGRTLATETQAENYDDYENITLTKGEKEQPCVTADEDGGKILFRNVEVADNNQLKVRLKGKGSIRFHINDETDMPYKQVHSSQWEDILLDIESHHDDKVDLILEYKQLSIQSVQLQKG
ncbi:glycoside hydrolase family 3 C-terminal domain-containing protein [Gracilibacillus caseinilyticus]|uniref:Glycoside hydrolase family 3 C-terminal domain-containing protein n=1 Tax=Gracilibacillus caseinilyticus TaxID=2932256 RepID=A0ABY4EVT3_9BACI|nr:glycoside hydrolase family 3 C-terminal domain-containing protein [Gracilibacillus caseinilyticus]UOQ48375.1 glycoside hydrolase family 3 C-terminal domain-containing protein [Gracilibacillus caseinilyticus]